MIILKFSVAACKLKVLIAVWVVHWTTEEIFLVGWIHGSSQNKNVLFSKKHGLPQIASDARETNLFDSSSCLWILAKITLASFNFICITASCLLFFILLTSVFVFLLFDPLLCRNEFKNADYWPKCKTSSRTLTTALNVKRVQERWLLT